jgi:hypothetical protein
MLPILLKPQIKKAKPLQKNNIYGIIDKIVSQWQFVYSKGDPL